MAKYKVAAFIDEYSDDPNEQVAALKKYAIRYAELRHCNGKNVSEFTDEDNYAIRRAFDENGIAVSAIGSPLGKISIEGDVDEHLRLAEKVFATANYFNARYVRMFSFYIPKGRKPSEFRGEVIRAVGRLADLADGYGVTLCHENEAFIYGESPENCLDLLDAFGGRIKCVFDMGNFVLGGYKPYPDAYEKLKKYIAYFHIKDALYDGAIVPAGKGEASIRETLEDFCGFADEDFFVSLEPHLKTFAGLGSLVGKTFDNPYAYETQQAAFDDAVEKFREITRDKL